MELLLSQHYIASLALVAVFAILFRLPHMNVPMDEDFAFQTYRAAFASKGIKWKEDVYLFFPQWKVLLIDAVYGSDPRLGIKRMRIFLIILHVLSSLLVTHSVAIITGNITPAVIAGLLYSYFATLPAISAHSYSNDQLYLPFMLASFISLYSGSEYVPLSAILLALGFTAKYPCAIYFPPMLMSAFWYYGLPSALELTLWTGGSVLLTFVPDYFLGYMDEESRRSQKLRFSFSLGLPSLKKRYGSIKADLLEVSSNIFPILAAGIPAIILSSFGERGLWFAPIAVAVFATIPLQRFFSRYHYFPVVATLSVATGGAVDFLLASENPFSFAILVLLAGITTAIVIYNLPFYIRPTTVDTLARYEKFDQFIYIPKLGKTLKRLMRMRKEDGRIFVWGNYTQLYYYTGCPASDAFVHFTVGPWETEISSMYYDTFIGGIVKHKPIYIIKTFKNLDMELLQEVTGLEYSLLKTAYSRFPVYRFVGVTKDVPNPTEIGWREKLGVIKKLSLGDPTPGIDKTDYEAGKFKRALKETRKLCRLNRYDTNGLFFLGVLLTHTRRNGEALSVFRKLLTIEPAFKNSRLMIAKLLMENSETNESKKLIEEEIDMFGKSMETAYHSGMLLIKTGETESAVKLLKEGLASYCGEETLRASAAIEIAEIEKGNLPKTETLRSFLQTEHDNAPLKYALASNLESSGNTDEAKKLFTEITGEKKSREITGAAWYRLALLSETGEQAEMLEKSISLSPDHRAAREMLNAFEKENAGA